MSKLNKILRPLGISFFAFLIAPTVFAVDISPFNSGSTKSPIQNVDEVFGPSGLFVTAVKWVYTIFFIVAVLFMLLAAYDFLRGGSNPERIKIGKARMKYAIIAIVIALIASGIRFIIVDILTP